jgi:hypothetical protein
VIRAMLALLLVVGVAWSADPATPAAHAADFPAAASAPGAPAAPAVQAGLTQAATVTASASRPWYADLGSIGLLLLVAAAGALNKLPLPPALAAVLGPYGALASGGLALMRALLEPAAAKAQRELQDRHAEAFRTVATVIQTTSNVEPLAALKARLAEHIPADLRPYVDGFVKELEARGINHDRPLITALPASAPAA